MTGRWAGTNSGTGCAVALLLLARAAAGQTTVAAIDSPAQTVTGIGATPIGEGPRRSPEDILRRRTTQDRCARFDTGGCSDESGRTHRREYRGSARSDRRTDADCRIGTRTRAPDPRVVAERLDFRLCDPGLRPRSGESKKRAAHSTRKGRRRSQCDRGGRKSGPRPVWEARGATRGTGARTSGGAAGDRGGRGDLFESAARAHAASSGGSIHAASSAGSTHAVPIVAAGPEQSDETGGAGPSPGNNSGNRQPAVAADVPAAGADGAAEPSGSLDAGARESWKPIGEWAGRVYLPAGAAVESACWRSFLRL